MNAALYRQRYGRAGIGERVYGVADGLRSSRVPGEVDRSGVGLL
jgi:hypothetical protein